MIVPIALWLAAMPDRPAWGAQRGSSSRVAPMAGLACDRNELTSYNGRLAAYEAAEGSTRIVIDTDWGTRETVVVDHARGSGPEQVFRLNGAPFDTDSWSVIQAGPEAPTPALGTPVIAWICLDGITPPVIDWRP